MGVCSLPFLIFGMEAQLEAVLYLSTSQIRSKLCEGKRQSILNCSGYKLQTGGPNTTSWTATERSPKIFFLRRVG